VDDEQTDRLPACQMGDGSGRDRRQAGHRKRITERIRRGYVTAKKPLPIHVLSQLMGHTDTKTTEIYLQVTGEEKRQMVVDAWDG